MTVSSNRSIVCITGPSGEEGISYKLDTTYQIVPQKNPPMFPSAPKQGVSSDDGGFFCGIVLIVLSAAKPVY